MSMKTTLKDAMKEAMRAKDKPRLSAIRLVQAEIKRVEVDERIDIDDARVLAILDKMVKQRRDSIPSTKLPVVKNWRISKSPRSM